MIIYKITNKINGKIYIGLTTTLLNKRIWAYKSEAKSDRPSKQRIVSAFKKHGFENFSFEQIDSANDREGLKKKEVEYISLFKSSDPKFGYNVSPGGWLISEESLIKKSKSTRGRPKTEEHKKKISTALMGHVMPDSVREALRKANTGKRAWNSGTKGIVRSNSGSFSPGEKGTRVGVKNEL